MVSVSGEVEAKEAETESEADAFDDINIDIDNMNFKSETEIFEKAKENNYISFESKRSHLNGFENAVSESEINKFKTLESEKENSKIRSLRLNKKNLSEIGSFSKKHSEKLSMKGSDGAISRINSISKRLTEDNRLPSEFEGAEEFIDNSISNSMIGGSNSPISITRMETKKSERLITEAIEEKEEDAEVDRGEGQGREEGEKGAGEREDQRGPAGPGGVIRDTIDIYNLGKEIDQTNFLYANEVRKAKEKEKYLENRLLKLKFENKQETLEKENVRLKLQVETLSEELLRNQSQLEQLIEKAEEDQNELKLIRDRNERVERDKRELKEMLKNKAKAEDVDK